MTKTKGEKKNVSILTGISALAGLGGVKLVEYAGQALASGSPDPTVAFFQGVVGLAGAAVLGLIYARVGDTSLPIDDTTLTEIAKQAGEELDDIENERTQ